MQLTEPQLAEHKFSHIIESDNNHDKNELVEQEEPESEDEKSPVYDNEMPPAYEKMNTKEKVRERRMNELSEIPNEKSSDSACRYLPLALCPFGLGFLIIRTIRNKRRNRRKRIDADYGSRQGRCCIWNAR